jgi:hypothetical protein
MCCRNSLNVGDIGCRKFVSPEAEPELRTQVGKTELGKENFRLVSALRTPQSLSSEDNILVTGQGLSSGEVNFWTLSALLEGTLARREF